MKRCGKANVFDGGHHLLDCHLALVITHHRLLRGKAHLRTSHTRKPFQGLLDQERSTGSGHPFDGQNSLRHSRGIELGQSDDGQMFWGPLKLERHSVSRGNPLEELWRGH